MTTWGIGQSHRFLMMNFLPFQPVVDPGLHPQSSWLIMQKSCLQHVTMLLQLLLLKLPTSIIGL